MINSASEQLRATLNGRPYTAAWVGNAELHIHLANTLRGPSVDKCGNCPYSLKCLSTKQVIIRQATEEERPCVLKGNRVEFTYTNLFPPRLNSCYGTFLRQERLFTDWNVLFELNPDQEVTNKVKACLVALADNFELVLDESRIDKIIHILQNNRDKDYENLDNDLFTWIKIPELTLEYR